MDIEVQPPKLNDNYYKFMAGEAYGVLSRRKGKKGSYDVFLNVIAGLCRQAYLKGRHDERNDK